MNFDGLLTWGLVMCMGSVLVACDKDNAEEPGDDTASDNSDGDADADSDVDSDSDSDGDADTDVDSDADADSDSDTDTLAGDILIFPVGASPDELYGDTEMQLVESGFGAESVDFTLGGMHADLPDPTYDCTDPMITSNCLSLVVDIGDGSGETYEYLWVGDDGLTAGGCSTPIEGYGVFSGMTAPYAALVTVFVKRWQSTPATFSEAATSEDPPNLDISGDFNDIGGSIGSSTRSLFREARINGWAAHTTDYGDEDNTVMVAAFAVTWVNEFDNTVRFRGTFKGYFRAVDIKK